MQSGPTNILDQLLVSPEVKASGLIGVGQLAEGAAPLFANILGLLTDPERIPGLGAQADQTAKALTQYVAEHGTDGTEPLTERPTAVPDASQLTPLGLLDRVAVPRIALTIDQETADVVGEQPQFSAQSIDELPEFDVNRLNPNLKTLLETVPVDLKSAAYQVLDSQVSDGRLHMTVVADDSGDKVRISVPAEILDQVPAIQERQINTSKDHLIDQRSAANRIPVMSERAAASSVSDDIYAKVNIRALEVFFEKQPEVPTAVSERVALSLVVDNAGQQVVVKTKLDRQKIDCSEKRHLSGTVKPQDGQSVLTDGKALTGETSSPFESLPSSRQVAVPSKNTPANTTFDLPDRLASSTDKATTEQALFADDRFNARTESWSRTVDADSPRVRMILPETSVQTLRSGGQSVMLKIEPESLGPARINLTLRHDVLTARVTVDTPLARAAVESSLDQLTEQLNRAGINVDRLEVSLSSGDLRQQFFDRRPGWDTSHKTLSAAFAEDTELEQVAPSSVFSAPTDEYLRSDGVNLLA